jgi:cytosol alanyl aminopeptidase
MMDPLGLRLTGRRAVARFSAIALLATAHVALARKAHGGVMVRAPEPPALRLPTNVRPVRYEATLTLDPQQDTFKGAIDIDVSLVSKTRLIWLHASEIAVQSASMTAGSTSFRVGTTAANDHFMAITLPRDVGPGHARLSIRYSGKIHDNDDLGVFRQREGGDRYLFSQFESIYARRAFPCFDEPSFKAPWKLSIRTRKDLAAVSNTSVESESDEGGGWKVVHFRETKPLSSYLVAFAIGPFDFRDAGRSRSGMPIRMIVPRGRSADVEYAATNTAQLLALIENYFGTPCPFDKLDFMTIPVSTTWGAMENPGMITFVQQILLIKPGELTVEKQRRYASVVAHEMAHLWVGDLVTMEWWDDIWLNEAFASWLEERIVNEWQPEWHEDVDSLFSSSSAMRSDEVASARTVRERIRTQGDILNAFDSITYSKGAKILSMFESFLGPEVFRTGVRKYIEGHSWKNATTEDFVASMSASAGRDVKPAFSTFLDQNGVPLVTASAHCEQGAKTTIRLAQSRYLPPGSAADPARIWKIPVCVRYGEGETTDRDCFLLEAPAAEFKLGHARACPDWVLPNASWDGYYRSGFSPGDLREFVDKGIAHMTVVESVGLLQDLRAHMANNMLPAATALAAAGKLAGDPNRSVVEASANIPWGLAPIISDELRPGYERFIRETYGARARVLGLQSRPADDEDTKLLRSSLLSLVGGEGNDPELVAGATKLARAWFEDRKAIDPETVDDVLSIAAQHGNRELFERGLAELGKPKDREDLKRILSFLGNFRNPDIEVKALDLVLSDAIEPMESIRILGFAASHRETRPTAYAFVKAHYDALSKRLSQEMMARLPLYFSSFCDESVKADVARFFGESSQAILGARRLLDQSLERISINVAFRVAVQPQLAAFFNKS